MPSSYTEEEKAERCREGQIRSPSHGDRMDEGQLRPEHHAEIPCLRRHRSVAFDVPAGCWHVARWHLVG